MNIYSIGVIVNAIVVGVFVNGCGVIVNIGVSVIVNGYLLVSVRMDNCPCHWYLLLVSLRIVLAWYHRK